MHQAIGTGKRKSSKRFSLLTFVLIGGCTPRRMDYRMQAGDKAVNGSPTLRIGERHAPSYRNRKAEIVQAI